jgi:transposase InsO family protein
MHPICEFRARLGAQQGCRQPAAAVLHHSDRGSQYASKDYRDALSEARFQIRISHRGDCYDNAPVESFFATLKEELVAGEVFSSRRQARREIVDCAVLVFPGSGATLRPEPSLIGRLHWSGYDGPR